MIDKTYLAPVRRRSALSIPFSRLRAGERVREVCLLHMREGDAGFVCAEGFKPVETPFSDEPLKLYAQEDELFSLNHVAKNDTNGLYAVFNKRSFYSTKLTTVNSVFALTPLIDAATKDRWCVVMPERCYTFILPGGVINYSQNHGGLFGLEYAHRVFVAQANSILYTELYSASNWDIQYNADYRKSGTITIPVTYGDFVGGTVFRGAAYFFAQYGVLEWRMKGDVLETKTESYPMAFGEVMTDTCRVLGGHIYFLTTMGVCRFDGSDFELVKTPCARRIDFSAAAEAGVFAGKYFANVALRDGNRRLYSYDPRTGRENFLNVEVRSFSAKNRAFAIVNNAIWELTERGMPPDGSPCCLCCRIALGGDNPCAEWVRVEGEGEFTVEASTAEDGCAFAKGGAGKTLTLSRTLRGAELSLTISAFREDFLITGVTVGVAEEERYDD